jgi:hypothetical protein
MLCRTSRMPDGISSPCVTSALCYISPCSLGTGVLCYILLTVPNRHSLAPRILRAISPTILYIDHIAPSCRIPADRSPVPRHSSRLAALRRHLASARCRRDPAGRPRRAARDNHLATTISPCYSSPVSPCRSPCSSLAVVIAVRLLTIVNPSPYYSTVTTSPSHSSAGLNPSPCCTLATVCLFR